MPRILRETHTPSAHVARVLALAGGANRFGEPNYRAVWGWNRLAWIGGKWEDRDAAGALLRERFELRYEPKYIPHDRWHIERWCPPELYGSPEQWRRATLEFAAGRGIPALGPYPGRGEYEHAFTLADARGNFVQLTATVAERIATMIERSRALAPRAGREALARREARADRAYDAFAGELLCHAR
jgi:hypothetical protein